MDKRFQKVEWGVDKRRERTTDEYWKQPYKWRHDLWKSNFTPRIFVGHLCDVLDDGVPASWLEDVIDLIVDVPEFNWLLLTKRHHNLHRIHELVRERTNRDTIKQLWLGVSAENQATYDDRVPALMRTPAAVHFVSVEPMLGPINITGQPKPDWIICGGESGPGARPLRPPWAEALLEQCLFGNVPFFFKQWGGRNKKQTGRELQGRTWDEFPKEAQ